MNFSPDFDSILHNNNADCTAMAVLICYKPDFSSKESAVDTHTKKTLPLYWQMASSELYMKIKQV